MPYTAPIVLSSFALPVVGLHSDGSEHESEGIIWSFDETVSDAAATTLRDSARSGSHGMALRGRGDALVSMAADTLFRMTSDNPSLPRPIDLKTGKHLARPLVWSGLVGRESVSPSAASRAYKAGALRCDTGVGCESIEAAATIQRAVISEGKRDGADVVQVKAHARTAWAEAKAHGQDDRTASIAVLDAIAPDRAKEEAARVAAKNARPAATFDGVSPAAIADAIADPAQRDAIIVAMVARMGHGGWAEFRAAANKAMLAAKSG